MRWRTMLSMSVCGLALAGCDDMKYRLHQDPDDTGAIAQPITCDGVCVETAPATFTGPSLFWLGAVDLARDCPAETPFQGLQGYVIDSMPVELARECRITPSDRCATEGLTCAPLPPEDFHLCIHRDSAETDCPPGYGYDRQSGMYDADTGEPVTLCCKDWPIAG